MASYLDKFKVNTAIEDSTKLDLSCQHITSADFFQLAPIYIKEMVPGEKLSVNCETFTRMAPLAVPTFGRIKMHNRAFFVPFRTIFKGWNDFITDTTHVFSGQGAGVSQIGSSVPTIQLNDLASVLYNLSNGFCVSTSGSTYDVSYTSDQASGAINTAHFNWTPKGRQVVKVLQSLGYQIPNSTVQTITENFMYVSALPLLAFAKIYCDWYWPSQYYDDTERTDIERFFVLDSSASGAVLSQAGILSILDKVYAVNYDSDYFVSAFNNPVGAVSNASSSVAMNDLSLVGTSIGGSRIYSGGSTNNTPVIGNQNNGSINNTYPSQWIIDALHKVTDYMKRHQLVGARAMDRYLARFGKSLSSEKLNRSDYLGSQEVPITIGDVMSNSETSSTMLGGFAGKGVGYSGNSFDYETDEYGFFIICSSIVPTTGYYQGFDRTVLHLNRFDFWTPEFDQLGTQAIQAKELFWPSPDQDDQAMIQGLNDQVFGWTPRYAEYKVGRDRLTGDWRIPTLGGVNGNGSGIGVGPTSESWHLMRKIDPDTVTDLVQSKNFVRGEVGVSNSYPSQYDRIFTQIDSKMDHFFIIHNFNVVSWSPMHALYDTYEFDDKGKQITADVNGVKVN